jgi:flagellar hook protein FlgE
MVKSMFAGVAGLRTHQQKMDVIGNNIANVNTWGYKAYSFNFQDSIYSTSIQSSGGATNAGAYGGRNPSQVGYGSSMASISFQYTTGAPSPTDNDLDCMIDGTGLFLVGGMVNGTVTDVKSSGLMLTRVGLFTVDNNGYLVDANKNYVYGYALKEGTGVPEIPETAYTATGDAGKVEVTDNKDGTYAVKILGITITTNRKDLEGQVEKWISEVTKAATYEDDGTTVKTPAGKLSGYSIKKNSINEFAGTVNLTITSKTKGTAGNGAIVETTGADPNQTGNFDQTVLTGWEAEDGQNYVAGIPAEFEENLSPIQIPYDPYTGAQYNLQSYSISDTGVIVGIDIEGRPITMGQLALIAVENPNGLEKTSGYYFNIGENAGDVEFVKPGEGPVGFIKSKFLEMPNVDLANEFSNMITTQRGFQANSKIITVTDEMLQELVNMKR